MRFERVEGTISTIDYPFKLKKWGWIVRAAAALSVVVCLSGAARAQQEQQQGQQDQQGQQQEQGQHNWQEKAQEPGKPPYSNDRRARTAGAGQAAQPSPDAQAVPGMLLVPAGTILLVRINEFLSSDRNQIGDQFTAELEQPIVVNGWVVARRGQVLLGQVKAAQKAGRVKGVSQLGVELTDLTVVDGRRMPILTELWQG